MIDTEGGLAMKTSPRRISNLWRCAPGGFAALGAWLSGLAIAAGAAGADETGQLEEVVVTAEYREEKLQDTPIAITALTSDMIEQQGATRLSDILTSAPSVGFRQQSAAFGESVTAFIRGFGQADFDPAFEPGVGLYVDDVYYPRLTGANFDLMDVERVEILRGPQGTLEGRNSEGGAIRFVTRKPTGDGSGYAEATYGTRNRLDLRAGADIKLADHLFLRLAGTFADQDGFVDVYSYGCLFAASGMPAATGGTKCKQYSQGDVGYRAVRSTLRFEPSDQLDALLSGDYIRDRHNNGAEILLYGNNPNPNVDAPGGVPFDSRFLCGRWCNYSSLGNAAGPFFGVVSGSLNLPATSGTQFNTLDAYDFALNVNVGITDAVKLNSITGYHNWTNQFSIDQDLSPAEIQFGNNTLTHWFWSQELRLNMDFGKSARATVGGYYSDERTTYYTLQDIRYVAAPGPVPLFPLQFIGNDPVRTNSKAAFGTLTWNATDALSFSGGLRYTKDHKSYTYYRFQLDGTTINPYLDLVGAVYGIGYNGPDTLHAIPGSGGGTVTALTGREAVFNGSRTDYHASADYRFNPQVMAYASIGTGYKAGGDSPRPFNAAQAIGFGPEKLTAYELGLKTDLLNRRVRFNTAVFYNDFKDAQLVLLSCPQYGPGPCALPQNAGNADVKGVEVEILAAPVAGLQFDFSASYLDWTWKCVNPEVVSQPNGPCSSDPKVISVLTPTPLGFIKEQSHAGIQYEFHASGGSSVTPRFDAAYQGPQTATANLAAAPGSASAIYGQVGGFTVANAHLTWRNAKKDLETTLEVTNVFNHYYFYSKFDLSSLAGTITGSPAPPLAWALTLKKSF